MDSFDPFGDTAIAAPATGLTALQSPVKPEAPTSGGESPSTASTSAASPSFDAPSHPTPTTSDVTASNENIPAALLEILQEWTQHTGSEEKPTLEKASALASFLAAEKVPASVVLFRRMEQEHLGEDPAAKQSRRSAAEEEEEEEEGGECSSEEEDGSEDVEKQEQLHEEKRARRLVKIMKQVVKLLNKQKLNQAALSWCFLMVHDLFKHRESQWQPLYAANPAAAIVEILQEQDALNVQAAGIAALCRLIRSVDHTYRELAAVSKTGALEMINKAMKSFERHVQIHINCGRALATVSINYGLVSHVKKLKLVDTAIRSLIDHRDVADVSGIDSALTNWASSDSDVYKQYKAHRVLPLTLERMLKFPHHLHLQKVGCYALYYGFYRIANITDNLLRFAPRKELIEADAIHALFKAMENFPDEARIHTLCMWAFYHAGRDSVQTVKLLHEMKAVECILDRIKFFPDDTKVLSACCCAIRSLSITKETKAEFKNRGAIALVEDIKRRFPQEQSLQHNANLALSRLKSSLQVMKQFVSRKFKQAVNPKYAQPLLVE